MRWKASLQESPFNKISERLLLLMTISSYQGLMYHSITSNAKQQVAQIGSKASFQHVGRTWRHSSVFAISKNLYSAERELVLLIVYQRFMIVRTVEKEHNGNKAWNITTWNIGKDASSFRDHHVNQKLFITIMPENKYIFKVNNRNNRVGCETCSKLTIETPERHLF